MKKQSWVVFAFASLPMFMGCAGKPILPIGVVSVGGPNVAPKSSFALDVQNQVGSVVVRVDPAIDRPFVAAITTDANGISRPATWAAADIEDASPNPVLRVLVMPAEAAPPTPTDVTITIPACSGLRIRNSGGPVTALGLAGAVDIQNGSGLEPGGEVRVTFAKPIADPVIVRTSSLSLTVDMPPSSAGMFSITSGSGQIIVLASDEPLTDATGDTYEWRGTFGGGANDVRLIADHGAARVRVVR